LDPYISVPAAGWGAGWSAGNLLRINTYSAKPPFWILQSILQGEPTDDDFNFCIEALGSVDRP
ncbi:MAG: hypothetical protein KAG26_08050, partial [Methylococcales bacterium]|nr:hypothetical protein [Methylococcales bacterium]